MAIEDAVRIAVDGTTVTTGASSARVAIPVTAANTAPRYVFVTATSEQYVLPGTSTVVATGNSKLVQPSDGLKLNVQGMTHIAYIQGASAGKVNIVPLEDQ